MQDIRAVDIYYLIVMYILRGDNGYRGESDKSEDIDRKLHVQHYKKYLVQYESFHIM